MLPGPDSVQEAMTGVVPCSAVKPVGVLPGVTLAVPGLMVREFVLLPQLHATANERVAAASPKRMFISTSGTAES